MDDFKAYRVELPPYPAPSDSAKLRAAVIDACEILSDVPEGYLTIAVHGITEIAQRGHSLRTAIWAVYRLTEAGAVIVRARSYVSVVSETQSTLHYLNDERPRFLDGRLIPDGPYPLDPKEQAPWELVVLEPVYEILDRIIANEGEIGGDGASPATAAIVEGPVGVSDLRLATQSESWFTNDPPNDSKYKYGPLQGTLAHLCRCIEMDRRTLGKHNGTGSVWVKKVHGKSFMAWFSSQLGYANANRRHLNEAED